MSGIFSFAFCLLTVVLIILLYLPRHSCYIERIIGSVPRREIKLRRSLVRSFFRARKTPRFNKMTISFQYWILAILLSSFSNTTKRFLLFSLNVIFSIQIKCKIPRDILLELRGRSGLPQYILPDLMLYFRATKMKQFSPMRLSPHVN